MAPNTTDPSSEQDAGTVKSDGGHPGEGQDPSRSTAKQETIGDILSYPETQTQLKFLGSLYALIGVGFGLMMFVIDNQLLSGDDPSAQILSGVIFVVLFALLIFMGPIVAALTGLEIARRFEESPKQAWLTSGVGNGIGYVAMLLVSLLIANSIAGEEVGELFDIGELLLPLIVLAIPTAIVGAGAAYLYDEFR